MVAAIGNRTDLDGIAFPRVDTRFLAYRYVGKPHWYASTNDWQYAIINSDKDKTIAGQFVFETYAFKTSSGLIPVEISLTDIYIYKYKSIAGLCTQLVF